MTHQDNRPERCGSMKSALSTIEIAANSALHFFEDPAYHTALITAMREVSKYAREALNTDDTMAHEDRAAFEAWLTSRATRSGGDGDRARNSYRHLTPVEAADMIRTHLRVPFPDCDHFLANAVEEGRWDNGWGYVLHHPDSDLFTVYAYEPATS